MLLRLMHPTARELGERELDAITGGTQTGPGKLQNSEAC